MVTRRDSGVNFAPAKRAAVCPRPKREPGRWPACFPVLPVDAGRRIADLPSKRLVYERLMQEAKRLLLFTASTVNEICYQLGFKDPAYFSRFFLRYAQMTPEEAKEHHPKVVFVDDENKIARVTNYEKHGKLTEDFI